MCRMIGGEAVATCVCLPSMFVVPPCRVAQRPDFYAENLKSTQYKGMTGTMNEVNCHRWDERLRIPVGKSSITRTLVGNLTARAFNKHVSQQKATTRTNEKICNGDKVFWWRPTRNLMWDAHITADSGDAAQLSDFLLYDSDNVSDFKHMPYEHGWRPRGGKGEATVTWDSPVVVREIHLFDQNNPDNQVKSLTIRLSNGREIAVGALPTGGTRVVVPTVTCWMPPECATRGKSREPATEPCGASTPSWYICRGRTKRGTTKP